MKSFRVKVKKKREDRAYIVPSWFGALYGIGTMVIVAIGAVYSTTGLFFLTFLMVTLGLVAMVQTNANLTRLSVKKISFDQAQAFGLLKINVSISNDTITTKRGLRIYARGSKKRGLTSQFIPSIGPHETIHVVLSLPVFERGVFDFPGIKLSSQFPLGLCVTWKWFKPKQQYFVYPEPSGAETALPSGAGEQGSQGPSVGDDFKGHRAYRAGDSWRQVDWKLYSRRRQVAVKEFDSGANTCWHLRWNSVTAKDPEKKLSQLSAWATVASEKGDFFSLELPTKTIAFGAGELHLAEARAALASFDIREHTDAA